ncbi:unnamed protein product [Amoebophrya sp. A25]|nr:unnamed protein product [Amoebophrya sp. A25]|eukprot:GSA25T00004458001.1
MSRRRRSKKSGPVGLLRRPQNRAFCPFRCVHIKSSFTSARSLSSSMIATASSAPRRNSRKRRRFATFSAGVRTLLVSQLYATTTDGNSEVGHDTVRVSGPRSVVPASSLSSASPPSSSAQDYHTAKTVAGERARRFDVEGPAAAPSTKTRAPEEATSGSTVVVVQRAGSGASSSKSNAPAGSSSSDNPPSDLFGEGAISSPSTTVTVEPSEDLRHSRENGGHRHRRGPWPEWAAIRNAATHEEWSAKTGFPALITHEFCWELMQRRLLLQSSNMETSSSSSSSRGNIHKMKQGSDSEVESPPSGARVTASRTSSSSTGGSASALTSSSGSTTNTYAADILGRHLDEVKDEQTSSGAKQSRALSEGETQARRLEAQEHRAAEAQRAFDRHAKNPRAFPADFRVSLQKNSHEDIVESLRPYTSLGEACEKYSGMLPEAAKLSYTQRLKMARGMILSDLLAKNRHAHREAEQAMERDTDILERRRQLSSLRRELIVARRRLADIEGSSTGGPGPDEEDMTRRTPVHDAQEKNTHGRRDHSSGESDAAKNSAVKMRDIDSLDDHPSVVAAAPHRPPSHSKRAARDVQALEKEVVDVERVLEEEESQFLEDRAVPFVKLKLDPTVVEAQQVAEKRDRMQLLYKKWQEDRDYFLRSGVRVGADRKLGRRKTGVSTQEDLGSSDTTSRSHGGEGDHEQELGDPEGRRRAASQEMPTTTSSDAGEMLDRMRRALNDSAEVGTRMLEWASGAVVEAASQTASYVRKRILNFLTGDQAAHEDDPNSRTHHYPDDHEEPSQNAAIHSIISLDDDASAAAVISASGDAANRDDWNVDMDTLFSVNHDGEFFVPPDLEKQLRTHYRGKRKLLNYGGPNSTAFSLSGRSSISPTSTASRGLQSGDVRIIGVVNSMPNQTLVKLLQLQNEVYGANEVPILNRIPLSELLVDDDSDTNDPQLQADDNPHLTSFAVYNFQSKSNLVLHQRRGSLFLYDIDSGTNDDVPRGADFNEVLAPSMRFRFHSCKENNAFCHVQSSCYIDRGIVVLDRHRVQIVRYVWTNYEGQDRIYDKTVEDMVLRMPQLNIFGQVDIAGGGSTGVRSPGAVVRYQAYSSTIFTIPSDDGFTKGHNITSPDFQFAGNPFLFVADTGNNRLVIFNVTGAETFEFYEEYRMSMSLKPAPEFNQPVALALFLPGFEYKEEPIFANLLVADRNNHRILKLDFGYYQYTQKYNFTVYDDFGFIDRIEERTHLYRLFNRGPYLEYSSQLGNENAIGSFSQGLLTEPISVQTYRHYMFVLQSSSDEVGVFTMNYNDTRTFMFVTKFTNDRKIEYGIGVSFNGYLWLAQQEARKASFEKDVAVFQLPRDLREGTYPEKISDLRSQCVDADFYNQTVMSDPEEFFRVVTSALNLSGLQYFSPNGTGSYMDYNLFNLSRTDLSVFTHQTALAPTTALDMPAQAGFNFALWNATIYFGLMAFCEVFIPTPPPMLFGGTTGWTSADGSALQSWDISASYRKTGFPTSGILWTSGILGIFAVIPYLLSSLNFNSPLADSIISNHRRLVR